MHTKQLPVIFELDDNKEATGYLNWFCSTECRAKFDRAQQAKAVGANAADLVDGESPVFSDGLICETCGTPLDVAEAVPQ